MRNSKKQEKPNNIKAKEFLPKDDGQPAKGGGGEGKGGQVEKPAYSSEDKKTATPSQPTTLISFTQ